MIKLYAPVPTKKLFRSLTSSVRNPVLLEEPPGVNNPPGLHVGGVVTPLFNGWIHPVTRL